jgi:HD superfamily phosphodiesterase
VITYKEISAKYDYGRGMAHVRQVTKMSLRLWNELIKLNVISSLVSDEYILEASGYLHDIGVSPKAKGEGEHNERSCKTLRNELSPQQLEIEETKIILDCMLFHRANLWQGWRKMAPKKSEHGMKLVAIFRIGDALDRSLQQLIKDISLKLNENNLKCEISPTKSSVINTIKACEITRAKEKSDLFKDIFGQSITFHI